MFSRLKDGVLVGILAGAYWFYSRLWRVRHVRRPAVVKSAPHIYAHWHGDELLLIGNFMRSNMAVMVSRSRDGERLQRLLSWFGFRVVRGSSSKGGAGGLKGLIDVVNREQRNASLAVDGPRGPIYKVKPGIIKLAQETGLTLIPGAAAADKRFVFKKAWNKCYLPLPFSRCVIVYGEPLTVPQGISEEEFEGLRQKLEQTLLRLKEEAEATYQRSFPVLQPQLSGV